ncbi:Metallo-dependent phosphatase [Anaeromyces robustus]|uniref:Metallo-dependent phosphatase n=1 Tax=Anaeromyces robustus TaxID=1754192 RepID=A0A1Y1X9X3_9FUNG|nr:Metallo-dependent phosphatase [Anaeromyces robustus]|eukprot:ORX82543.1 Metallo-dependent phosphatase [Anaeromyces robustus]
MRKRWVLDLSIFCYAISACMFFIFKNGLNYKSKNYLGNYENIITVNEKTNTTKNYNASIIDNKPTNIFYFVQITDIHISEVNKYGHFAHLKFFVENVLPIISPKFVFVTGDIVDAGGTNHMPAIQKEREWKAYKSLLDQNEFLRTKDNKTFWFDLRGNHDSFNTPYFDHERNLYKNYSRTQAESFHISYETDFGSYTFNSLDATPKHGPPSPYNLFGTVDKERMDKLASIYDFAKANNHKHIFTFSHYPITTAKFSKTSDGRSFNTLSKQTSLYLSGHLHDLLSNSTLYSQHKYLTELELKDLKLHGVYRIIAVDHDSISFTDKMLEMNKIPYKFGENETLETLLDKPKFDFGIKNKPVVLITNPQDTSMKLSKHHYPIIEDKKLTHVRTLIFSENPINTIELYIDNEKISTIDALNNPNSSFKLIGNNNVNSTEYLPLYAMEWKGNESYNDGKIHVMVVKAYDSNNIEGENSIHFSFSNKREDFRIGITKYALRFYLPFLLPFTSFCLTLLFHVVLAIVPFLYIHNKHTERNEFNYTQVDATTSSDSNSSNDSNSYKSTVASKKEKTNLFNRLIIKPLISFASNPYLFYPYYFFFLYSLIGPQIYGNLLTTGDTSKEKFVIAFLHGVISDGQIINVVDSYFYYFKDFWRIHIVLYLQILYLNHCKSRQFYISIIFHLILIYFFCIKPLNRYSTIWNYFQFLRFPFYSWFTIWRGVMVIYLLIYNYIKYPFNYRKIFKNQ